ncbi:MAG TPA: pentapeptide repeat-containing protein [Thermoanaerobaculia bacterium]
MPSTRPLVSGRDFQLRYALYRAMLLALRLDPLALRVARMRLEAPVGALWLDLVLEDAAGAIVEIAECKEHEAHLDLRSVRSFLQDAVRVGDTGAQFRFVSNARFLKDGSDFSKPAVREAAMARWPAALRDTARSAVWEVGVEGKSALTAECVFHLSAAARDPRGEYARLYARFAGQMSARLQAEGDIFIAAIRDLHQLLFGELDTRRLEASLNVEADDFFAIEELRRKLAASTTERDEAAAGARRSLEELQARTLFGESEVRADEIFIEPQVTASVQRDIDADTGIFTAPALTLLFDWLSATRVNAGARQFPITGAAGARAPLLLLGPFGSGKSTLLATFAERLLDSKSAMVPIFVPLRDLIAGGTDVSLFEALITYVEYRYEIDLKSGVDDAEYCLICDGFDELNLYYSHERDWVEEGFRQLAFLAKRRNRAVIISSRPILFMGSQRMQEQGATVLHLQPFDEARIALWMDKYRSAARLDPAFAMSFLEARNLVEVAETPIVLYMIARIFETEPKLLDAKRYTRAEVYRLFITWTQRGGYRQDARKHRLPENYREILQDIAWYLFQSGEGFMEEGQLLRRLRETYGTAVDRIPVDRNLLVAHMLRPVASQDSGRQLVEFTHQSFREYLVAERVWRFLEGARRTGELRADDWMALSGRVYTSAKMQLLGEMIEAMPMGEAQNLARALDGADNVHAYWAKWSAPKFGGGASVEELKTYVATLATRAIAHAAFAFALRVKLSAKTEVSLDERAVARLRALLLFADSLPAQGVGGESGRLLMENLSAARLSGGDLSRVAMYRANFSHAVVTDVDFSHANLQWMFPSNARFERCRFEGAQLMMLRWSDVAVAPVFVDCALDREPYEFFQSIGATLENCAILNAPPPRPEAQRRRRGGRGARGRTV